MSTRELENFAVLEINAFEANATNGGHSASEIRFLMDANRWSEAQAIDCLDLANAYACRA